MNNLNSELLVGLAIAMMLMLFGIMIVAFVPFINSRFAKKQVEQFDFYNNAYVPPPENCCVTMVTEEQSAFKICRDDNGNILTINNDTITAGGRLQIAYTENDTASFFIKYPNGLSWEGNASIKGGNFHIKNMKEL